MNLDHLSGRELREAEELLRALEQAAKRDPIATRFHACARPCGLPGCKPHPKQDAFLTADTRTVAYFGGNRSGKTTALVVKSFIQHYPEASLPTRLRPYRRVGHDKPVKGRLMCPSAGALNGYVLPKLREWAPLDLLHGNSFDKAWKGQHNTLLFKNGGLLEIKTYEMDADKLVGADLDYVAYDEPPPESHRKENMPRLWDRDGFEMFALTPVNMGGSGIGWLYREIWKNRESPEITVVKGSTYDNPHQDHARVEQDLQIYSKEEQEARLHGDFVHLGGLIYPGGFERRLFEIAPGDRRISDWEVLVGIDPGLKNCALVWIGFDQNNVAYVFDEVRLHDKTPVDYAKAIRATNEKWGIRRPLYIIDPSARNRSLVNKESVQADLQRHGVPCTPGQNQVEAGVQQIRRRIETRMFWVASHCRHLRDEAEEYRMQDRPDGEFHVVKEADHGLDAARYCCAARPFYAWPAEVRKPLGWDPSTGIVTQQSKWLRGSNSNTGPLGSWA